MDFSLTEEQVLIRSTLRKFIQRECGRETLHALDEDGRFPANLLGRLAEMGLCGFNTPEALQGSGPDLTGTLLVLEEIAAVSPGLAALYSCTSLFGGHMLARFAGPAHQQNLLPQIVQGQTLLVPAFSEDIAFTQNRVRAISQAGELVLSGRINNVLFACFPGIHYLIVPAEQLLAPQDKSPDITIFLVRTDTPGLSLQPVPGVGLRGCGLGDVLLENVHLRADQILGGLPAIGQPQLQELQALQHICAAGLGLGLAQGAYSYALNYARERSQFGKSLLQFEAVENMLVDLAVGIQSARWLAYQACWLADQGKPFGLQAGMARLQAGSLARQAGLQCVHILGGYGYMAEYDAQRTMRDALVLFPGAEASDSLKTKIGRQLHSL